MTDKTTLFDAADYLETPEEIAAFLDEALEIGDPAFSLGRSASPRARSSGACCPTSRSRLRNRGDDSRNYSRLTEAEWALHA